MIRKLVFAATAAVGLAATAVPATAQQNGLVNVAVRDIEVLNNSVNNNNVEVLNNLLRNANLLNNANVLNSFVIQVPIGIAANVCGVSAAVLGAAGTAAPCTARNSSPAFGNAVMRTLQNNPTSIMTPAPALP